MVRYRRIYLENREALFFLTYVTKNRVPWFKSLKEMRTQWSCLKETLDECNGSLFAFVFLNDHSHIILKQGDRNYSESVKLFKQRLNNIFVANRGSIWQPRFWEHTIRDDKDLVRHVDYIHFNPVKHQYATKPSDYPYSSFKKFLKMGHYTEDWGDVSDMVCAGEPAT